jgi:hypothetical protein
MQQCIQRDTWPAMQHGSWRRCIHSAAAGAHSRSDGLGAHCSKTAARTRDGAAILTGKSSCAARTARSAESKHPRTTCHKQLCLKCVLGQSFESHGQTHAMLSNAACAKHSAQRVQAIATDSTGVHTIAHAAALLLSPIGAKALARLAPPNLGTTNRPPATAGCSGSCRGDVSREAHSRAWYC